ncbi:MAG: Fur family transcriptional regulator [Anaerolineales bacterium]|jgi:Fur family peroxide stress response transcriptional regulator
MTEQVTRIEDLTARLRSRGDRMTPQRMAVLKVIIGNEEHLTAEQIYKRVKPDFPMISLATVYKTLSMLKEMGEILELDLHTGCKHYDGHRISSHPHLICTECGTVIDIEEHDLSNLSKDMEKSTGFEITKFQANFFGICPQCQKR